MLRHIMTGDNIMETEAIDNQANLVNYDNENENEIDDLGYQSKEYIEDAHEDDENNHSNGYANIIFDFRLELVPLSLLVSGDVILSTVRSSTKHNLVSPSCDFVIL
ncbi:hypothetical protein Tco_0825940 [Tanacetum coccineum]